MLCRIFSKLDSTRFSRDWVPLFDTIVNSSILNWADILSNYLVRHITEYRNNISVSLREIPQFYMSAYVMDAICFTSNFPTMGWKWTTKNPTLIHIYLRELWDSDFHLHFYRICYGVILPMHQMIFNKKAPRVSEEANVDIIPVARSFVEEKLTYIRVFGSHGSPHVLPYYVPDKLIAK